MDFGGHMRFTFGGTPIVIRAKVMIEPADEDIDVIVNQDRSVRTTGKPKAFRWSATFEDTPQQSAIGFDWNGFLKNGPYNITIPEDETGVLHTFSGCQVFGKPKIDRETGEVSGIEGAGSTYTRTSTS